MHFSAVLALGSLIFEVAIAAPVKASRTSGKRSTSLYSYIAADAEANEKRATSLYSYIAADAEVNIGGKRSQA
ncbi:hypothetical protein VFPPC_13440 [Pochonia chlamydosporia 170]|uniref:Uncharacterized protein n=1 Tax=Pochonia chlamydosporia 170 TaxID=1380566 RepID=A0A179FYZ1_METCM|nr:hypothetical protein VFPPC_13440 [Pochonia chlamydosporia 170]OAQ70885.1 hypothetical protein VFPPC_13440 [Pochonia chlamydosporia 170]